MNTPLLPTCPKCGATLPVDAPKGLCPRCLAAMNFATETVLTGADALAAQPPLSPAELAPHFPQLEIIECLGRGGMGVVYKARQKSLNRVVALKLLAPERVSDAKFAQRFTHEAQALATLNHPSIVTIYDFGQAGGFYYLLMEFVDGVNLRQAMKAGRFTPEQALAVVPPVCEALQYAHEHGIVHRDIKPENLLMDKVGRVKIADFGIAKLLHADGSDVGLADSQPAGTPQYMAPEQKDHQRADHRADIYSLGVVLYELLTGELPADKLQPPSRKVQIDVRLDEIVLRALEAKPELRFQTAGEFRTQVEMVVTTPLSNQPVQGKVSGLSAGVKRSPSPVAAFVSLHICLLGFLLWSVPILPETVASQFDGNGTVTTWMSRPVYLLLMGALPIFLGGILTFVGWLVKNLPPESIRIPRRDFWLTPERRAVFSALMMRRLLWLACLMTGFVGALHGIVVMANSSVPPHLSGRWMFGLVISFLLLVLLWIVRLMMVLAEPERLAREETASQSGNGPKTGGSFTARFAGVLMLLIPVLLLGFLVLRFLSQEALPSRLRLSSSGLAVPSSVSGVEVGNDSAVVRQRRYDGEGMMITFGTGTNRWTPGGLYLEAMFDVTLGWSTFGHGANWTVKTRHGIYNSYRLDGTPGPMLGKIVFHPGTPTPAADGSYEIGEFRPEKGEPLPITVRLEKDNAKTAASLSQPQSTHHPTVVEFGRRIIPHFNAWMALASGTAVAVLVFGIVLRVRKSRFGGKVIGAGLILLMLFSAVLLTLAELARNSSESLAQPLRPGGVSGTSPFVFMPSPLELLIVVVIFTGVILWFRRRRANAPLTSPTRKSGTGVRIVLWVVGGLLLLFGVSVFTRFVRLSEELKNSRKAELAARASQENFMPATNAAAGVTPAATNLEDRLHSLETQNVTLASALAKATTDNARLEIARSEAERRARLFKELAESAHRSEGTNPYPSARHFLADFGRVLGTGLRTHELQAQDGSTLTPEQKETKSAAQVATLQKLAELAKASAQFEKELEAPGADRADMVACLLYGALELNEQQFSQTYNLVQRLRAEAERRNLLGKSPTPEALESLRTLNDQARGEFQQLLSLEQSKLFQHFPGRFELIHGGGGMTSIQFGF